MPYSKRLAREIVNRRLEAGLSQTQLVQKAELGSQNYLSLLERDIPDDPSFPALTKIGRVLGVSPNYMATIAGWWIPPPSEGHVQTTDPRLIEMLNALGDMDSTEREEYIRTVYKLLIAYRASEIPRVRSSTIDDPKGHLS